MIPRTDGRSRLAATVAVVLAAALCGCATTSFDRVDEARLAEVEAQLGRPLPGDIAALYRLHVPRAGGGLRAAVITAGDAGRWTIAEAFGAALSLTAWTADGETVLYDMEAGCRRPIDDEREVLGIDAFPMSRVARLLGGRLPASSSDEVTVSPRGIIQIRGDEWAVTVRVAAEPWRVVEVRPLAGGWRARLDDHRGSVPGRIRVKAGLGRSARLELVRIEWPERAALPGLPDFPPCGRR